MLVAFSRFYIKAHSQNCRDTFHDNMPLRAQTENSLENSLFSKISDFLADIILHIHPQ